MKQKQADATSQGKVGSRWSHAYNEGEVEAITDGVKH